MTPKDIYESCRSWLQFAETKNGFALAFCGAILAAETSLLSGVDAKFKPLVLLSMLLIAIAAICSLASFVPQKRAMHDKTIGKPESSDGIVYFSDIAGRNRAAYVTEAAKVLGIQVTDKLAAELLSQCHNLSVITVRKLKLFYASVMIAGFAIVAPLLMAAIRTICG